MPEELVHYSVTDGVATITLDSPHNRNALSTQLRTELATRLRNALEANDVRVIVLGHTGTVFCAGMDLKEARGAGTQQQGVSEFPQILTDIWQSPKPIVAKLAGPARAGGIGLVAAADIAVAVDNATFAFSEVRIGVIPAVISVTVLPRLNARAAHELFLTGETFSAARAVEAGLLNSAVASDQLDAEVDRYVGALIRGGPIALAATKELLRTPKAASLSDEFDAMNALSTRLFASAEGQEGITAFVEKRQPHWVEPTS